jgi:hypothetical protein
MKGGNKMYNFKSLVCCNCNSVMLNLPKKEVAKLNGLYFRCECCGHLNLLKEFKFLKAIGKNRSLDSIRMEDFLLLKAACV